MTRFTPQWLQSGSYAASQDRRLIGALWPAPASSGCQVTAGSGMTIYVAAGTVAVPTQNGTGTTLCTSDALEQINIAAAPGSGQNRIDLVICRPRGNDLDGGANNDFIFDSIQGVVAASPAVPATPAGTTALAQVYVGGGVAAIGGGNITDVRPFGLSVNGAAALPPPLTTGSTVQSFTDTNGEVWVAKNGVYGGSWRKARDVLHARWWRAAAYSVSATPAAIPFDTVVFDPYGLWTPGSQVMTAPIPGLYDFRSSTLGAGSTAGWFFNNRLTVNGVTWAMFVTTAAAASTNMTPGGAVLASLLAGQTCSQACYASGTWPLNVTAPWNAIEFSYRGTG